jgi:hypothetical protein
VKKLVDRQYLLFPQTGQHSKFGSHLCKIRGEKHYTAFVKVLEGSEIYNFPIRHFVHFYSTFWSYACSNRVSGKWFQRLTSHCAPSRRRPCRAARRRRPAPPGTVRRPRPRTPKAAHTSRSRGTRAARPARAAPRGVYPPGGAVPAVLPDAVRKLPDVFTRSLLASRRCCTDLTMGRFLLVFAWKVQMWKT